MFLGLKYAWPNFKSEWIPFERGDRGELPPKVLAGLGNLQFKFPNEVLDGREKRAWAQYPKRNFYPKLWQIGIPQWAELFHTEDG